MLTKKAIYQIFTSYVLLTSIVLFSGASFCLAQQIEGEQIKRAQRTIFIYNIAEQITWPTTSKADAFTVGVLGPDRTAIDLQVMAQKRKIAGKTVKVVSFNKVKDIEDIQLLYVHEKYHYDLEYILRSISKKNILLISEDYHYHSSMVNMVNVGQSFEYEINKSLLISENFDIAPSLEQYAVNSSEKWRQLFEVTRTELIEKEEIVAEQTEVLKDKNTLLNAKEEIIERNENLVEASKVLVSMQQDSIFKLALANELQMERYEDKVLVERALQKTIERQVYFLRTQKRKIKESDSLLQIQKETLEQQDLEIAEKGKILQQQNDVISTQEKVNILLIVIALLLLVGGLFLYRSYRTKRKLIKTLASKNMAYEAQSKLLQQKNTELEQFAYIASHDLQEPLNSISSLIGILKEDYQDVFDEVAHQSLEYMDESSTRMRGLINALLKHSKLGLIEEKKPVDVVRLLGNIETDLKELIQKTNTQLVIDDLPTVQSVEVELAMVFQNLITNAIKFTKSGVDPTIEITAYKNSEQTHWIFSVSDNGIGIPEQYQDRIFSIFQRLHNREEYEGTGIGLAHVKKIVESQGGAIWVESEEGNGSNFMFTLPIV